MGGVEIATSLLLAAKLYAAAGALVAVLFLLFGLERVTPEARGSWAFRPLLAPGLVLLWPLVLWRWRTHTRGGDGDDGARAAAANADGVQHAQRASHFRTWLVLAALLPLIFWLALTVKQNPATLPPPQQLAAPEVAP